MNSTKKIKVEPTPRFYKDLKRIPTALQQIVWEKLIVFEENPRHPSLRVKKMRGRRSIWELSVTQEYRITFQWRQSSSGERIALLRRVGTHAILKSP